MSHAVRVAVHMQPITDGSGESSFKAALPMGVLFEKSLDATELEQARCKLEEDYRALVETLRAKRAAMKTGNVLVYWDFGDALVQFEQAQQDSLLFVDGLVEHLARDVDFSPSMISRCRQFRETFPDVNQVDPKQSFTNYHRAGFDPSRLAPIVRRRGRPRK